MHIHDELNNDNREEKQKYHQVVLGGRGRTPREFIKQNPLLSEML